MKRKKSTTNLHNYCVHDAIHIINVFFSRDDKFFELKMLIDATHAGASWWPKHRLTEADMQRTLKFPMETLLMDNRSYFCDWFEGKRKKNINDFLPLCTQQIWVQVKKEQIDQNLRTNWYWLLRFETVKTLFLHTSTFEQFSFVFAIFFIEKIFLVKYVQRWTKLSFKSRSLPSENVL